MISEESAESARVYGATAARYSELIGTEISSAIEAPLDRAILGAFAEMLLSEATPNGLVADLGCGPGRAAAFFDGQGLEVIGFDLAEGMIDAARRAHPDLRFEIAPLTNVPLENQTLAGAAYWYSIIHTPIEGLPAVWAESLRLLRPGGVVLLGFQAGNGERIEQPDAQSSGHTLINVRHHPAAVVTSLEACGFEVLSVTTRAAAATHEASPQAFVMAQSPATK